MSISVKSITKLYGNQKALDNVSFEISSGEIFGFLGPNGAGKSTMMRIITGFISPSSGKVLVNNLDILEKNIAVKKQIGYLPENNPLYLDMYVREYLYFIARLYNLRRKDAKSRTEEIITKTGLSSEQKKKIGELSKGYRQRVGLAQALIHNPSVLILDEPTSGLDPNQTIEIRNLITEVGKQKTVLLSTHIMQEVEAICDRVIIINNGKIVADNKKEDLQKNTSPGNHQTIIVEFNTTVSRDELLKIKGVSKVQGLKQYNWLIETDSSDDIRPEVFQFAVKHHLTVLSMQQKEMSLEQVFQLLTK
ncbi:MAG: gliding motility-associated ABC transporter ATP-binding subunit GldA [Bacteroidetes bacterium CG23_combo_of_CG06-09_8_20_14_all_32_9]|nr:MAG: gliding motility-associated ABC transporter ATP-binding subunit GldA [Bacteroidetes bacterium CG23_combo_of_CG06-09_8_20_14_all_32_9]